MVVSENLRGIEGSATLAIAALCRDLRAKGREVIDLGIGEPDFRTPEFVSAAGIASIEQGFTQYTPVPGIMPLRQAIADHITRETGHPANANGIVVSCGAKHALFNACFALFGPGDTVLIPVPYWTSYPALVQLARATPRFVTTQDAGFKITVGDLERAYTPDVRGMFINTPSSPAGTVYTRDELTAILQWAKAHDVWVISDEIYSKICFTAERAPSVLDCEASLLTKVVVVDGASKSFAMTGWRLGYSYSSVDVARELATLQSHVTSNAAAASQYAALAAYKDEARAKPAVAAMVRIFAQRRDKVIAQLKEQVPQAIPVVPEGAFYIFLRVDGYFTDSVKTSSDFCSWLLEKTGVALVPGVAFGDDRYVRLGLCAPNAALAEAVKRMGEHLKSPIALPAT